MKILMFSSNTACSPYPTYPLGCSIICSALREHGHEVKIMDMMVLKDTPAEKISCEIRKFSPDLAGISIRNIDNVNLLEQETFLDAPCKLVEVIRSICPGIPVVLGGSAFSIMPEQILDLTGADYGIAGEGEEAFPKLVSMLQQGLDPPGKILHASQKLTGNLIRGDSYATEITEFYSQQGSILPIQTKRGCPNKCVYCTYPHIEGRTIRTRDPEDVVADMTRLKQRHNADFIFFTDSVFNDSEGRYMELVEHLGKNNPGIPWTAFFQPHPGLNRNIVKRLADCGLHSVELGPDATSDITLKAMGKNFPFDQVLRCNSLFASHNIAVANYFMMGGPGETKETAREGVENIRKLDMSVCFVFIGVRILPNTPLYRMALSEKIITKDSDLISPVYYFSPMLEQKWLEDFLGQTLSKIKHCVYPPNSMDDGIRILRSMGYRGNLWEMMVKDSKRIPMSRVQAS
ncbi:MAG: cobalamin-dependent protein [Victivallales bacterium]|nr:cobalamin-dependent protein [Victivallales bacterium]